ncbi:electron transport complex subunit RsxC [Luminiphilus sp.]|nr:electron transport complex subunit RsxC [Luminiphilus sp.]
MNSVFNIHGGIHPEEEKHLSNPGTVLDAGLPPSLVLPLSQHIGKPSSLLVEPGDQVLGGQLLADADGMVSVPLHAPTSGTVVAIEPRPVPHPSALNNLCLELACDGEDRWVTSAGCEDWRAETPESLIARIRAAGIAGMGGAGFPTAVKLMARDRLPLHTLIINGTECEPYITADDTLMQVDAVGIVEGAQILAYILGVEQILLAVEDNKPAALEAMQAAVKATDGSCEVMTFPTKYPSGGEKQLIEILTGQQVPAGGLPANLGIVCQNPGTAVAARDAICLGKPLTDRIVTLTGRALTRPGNYRTRLGTPIEYLLAIAGFDPSDNRRLIHGGPMMGFALESAAVPIVKTTNCILVPTEQELPTPPAAQACIRCGLCAEACPASLLPQQLYWYARAKDQEQLERHHLADCIECGACSWVCPSHIPLVQYYRAAKGMMRESKSEKIRSDRSRDRFEARQERLEQETLAREAQRAARRAAAEQKAAEGGADDPVAAAIARAKAKKDNASDKGAES